ncbi:cell envelope integrity protein CreD [Leptospira ognonensis]|uniref:Cell envelope integrity protein CreD n=1 Tax=Leptospira ognonensis TaxID=2484945 RepID=A0A4R9JUL2_9LEPT|nr:cell envelope integrity protein CreD [Leptospira ognonensis]TGL56492.1 cell envelope integrity protein CreD [Leptospira ognonensis]
MSKFQTSINIRLMILGGMILAFLIPLLMISSLIEERSISRNAAADEMGDKWGKSQIIAGPILQIPYNMRIPKSGSANSKDKWDYVTEYAYILPEDIYYDANLKTELRKRSIYETPLYAGQIKISGKFRAIDTSDFPSETTYIYFEDAKVFLSLSDMQGLGGEMKFNWGGKNKNLLPGTRASYFPNGLHALVSLNTDSGETNFNLVFDLKGSSSLYFSPIGKNSKFTMTADWKDPSFAGNILPKERSITEEGFSAVWESSYFARSYPQHIMNMDESMSQLIFSSSSGVDLVLAVDYYHKIQRATKYGLLILVTSFAIFFLMEIFGGVILHPIQYLLIGSAMILFYILNLSLSEHIGFLPAYTVASLAVTGLIGYYAASVLKNQKKGMMTSIYYLILYTFLYIILASEEQALLLGSCALFAALAAIMHFTRKIDWYQFGKETQ